MPDTVRLVTRTLIVQVTAPASEGGVEDYHLSAAVDAVQDHLINGARKGTHLRTVEDIEYRAAEQTYVQHTRLQRVQWKSEIFTKEIPVPTFDDPEISDEDEGK